MKESTHSTGPCGTPSGNAVADRAKVLLLPEQTWQQLLPPETYRIMRDQGTEPPFHNAYHQEKRAGLYLAATTGQPLFTSEAKFDSGTGWPSFHSPVSPEVIAEEVDRSYGMERREVYASACGSHLGHVFPDGPKPTGLRYCINSAALRFVPLEGDVSLEDLVDQYDRKATDWIKAQQTTDG